MAGDLLHLLILHMVQLRQPGPLERGQLRLVTGKDLLPPVRPLHPQLAQGKAPRPDPVLPRLVLQQVPHLEKSLDLDPGLVQGLHLQPNQMHPDHQVALEGPAAVPEKDPDLEVAQERRQRLLADLDLGQEKVLLPHERDRGHHLGQDPGPDQQVGPDGAPDLDQDQEKAQDRDLVPRHPGRLLGQEGVQGQDLALGKGHVLALDLEEDQDPGLDQERVLDPGI